MAEKRNSAGAAPADRPFIISRSFDSPRERMWKIWTECEHLKQWWGPKGVTVTFCKIDLRPGGLFHYGLRSPDGQDIWGKFVYREIVKPERLVFIVSFSDEKGGTTRHPFNADWPLKMLSTVSFTEHRGKTTVTVQWSAFEATEVEHKTFDAGHASMQQGWTGTLDQLTTYLAKA